jgi:hypothetical protein
MAQAYNPRSDFPAQAANSNRQLNPEFLVRLVVIIPQRVGWLRSGNSRRSPFAVFLIVCQTRARAPATPKNGSVPP